MRCLSPPEGARYETRMSRIEELQVALAAAEANGELDAADTCREALLELLPDGERRGELHYRLGLSLLLRRRALDDAMPHFKAAAEQRDFPLASEARISHALCLAAKQKRQQAIFELRRLLPARGAPTPQSARALEYLSVLLEQSGAPAAERDAVLQQRVVHLEALLDQSTTDDDRALFGARLAAALLESAAAPQRASARTLLPKVVRWAESGAPELAAWANAQLKAPGPRHP